MQLYVAKYEVKVRFVGLQRGISPVGHRMAVRGAEENGPVRKRKRENCIKEGLRPPIHPECREYPRVSRVLPLICPF